MSLHDRQRIEQLLRSVADPTAFLINLFAHAPVAFAVWRPDGSPLLTNAAFLALFGSEPPPDFRVLEDPQLRASGMLPLFQRAFAGETVHVPVFWFDPRLVVGEGRRVAVSITIFPLLAPSGELEFVAVTYKDETELRTLADQLLLSEERLRLAQQAAQVGIFEWNVITNLTTWSTELELMYGLLPGEFDRTQHSWEQLVHPDDRAYAIGRLAHALATTESVEAEWRVRLPDGRVRWIFGRFQAFSDGRGVVQRVIGVNLDITERKQREAALAHAEERSRAVTEAALDAIVVMDDAGVIVDFNPAAEQLFGYRRDEVRGRMLGDVVVPPALRDAHRAGLARYLATRDPHVLGRRVELSALRRDGSEFPAEIAVVQLAGDGAPRFTGHIRDVTERKRAEEAEILRRAKDAAEAANVELEAFSYSVAHDLRAPLRAMSGFASVLREDYGAQLDAEAHRHLERISTAATRMGALIDGLLALSRISQHELAYETIDLGKLARELIPQLAAGRDIEWLIADGLIVRGDPVLMQSVMTNLLGNAVKFTAKTPRPRIEVGRHDGAVFIRDNGSGFDMAHVSQLFRPFKRLHTAEYEGSGIGLATVERVIRRHGGKIWAAGARGAGATFYFTM